MVLQKHFNFKRFLNYLKYDFTIYGKIYTRFILGLFLAIFILSLYDLTKSSVSDDFFDVYAKVFRFTYIAVVLLILRSFPALRDNASSINFLLIPVSIFEKFLAEFILKIIINNLIIFFIFWVAFKFSSCIYGFYEWSDSLKIKDFGILDIFKNNRTIINLFILVMCFFVMSFLFMCTSHFKKGLFFKSILVLSLLGFIYYALMVGLSHVLYDNSKGFDIVFFDRRINYQLNSSHLYFFIFTSISSLFFLTITYFNLKEKEV